MKFKEIVSEIINMHSTHFDYLFPFTPCSPTCSADHKMFPGSQSRNLPIRLVTPNRTLSTLHTWFPTSFRAQPRRTQVLEPRQCPGRSVQFRLGVHSQPALAPLAALCGHGTEENLCGFLPPVQAPSACCPFPHSRRIHKEKGVRVRNFVFI